MAETVMIDAKHLHKDIVKLQQDISVIKHILSEEGKLTEWAKKELAKSRSEQSSSYVDLKDV